MESKLAEPQIYTGKSTQIDVERPIAIRFENLTRRFGDFIAVDNINLEIPHGSFFGFLGPNGAGKSTTINMLIGLIKATSGTIHVDDIDISNQPIEVKRKLGIVPEQLNLYDRLKGREFLEFSGAMYGIPRDKVISRTTEILDMLEIDGEKLIVDLSMGMKKKVNLGAAILHEPSILILDEPFISIDAISARKIKNILERMVGNGVTIFMTSHILELIEKMCDHVAIINQGKILLHGSMKDILNGIDGSHRSLEDIFVNSIGLDYERGELSWIK